MAGGTEVMVGERGESEISIPSSDVRETFFISLIEADLLTWNFAFFWLFLGFNGFGSSSDVLLSPVIMVILMSGVADGLTTDFASGFLDLGILGVVLVVPPTPRMFSTTCCQYRSMTVWIPTGLTAENDHIIIITNGVRKLN